MKRYGKLLMAGAWALLAALPSAVGAADPKEQACIDQIAAMLVRVGEAKTAARLKRDFAAGRVQLAPLGGDTEAETGKPVSEWANNKPNRMTLNRDKVFQQVAEARTGRTNPLLLGWAVTVVHEYVHMDQVNPTLTAKYETPAWLASSDALRRWLGMFHRDFERAQTLKEPARSRLLQELSVWVGEIGTLAGAFHAEILDKINHRNAVGMKSPQVDPKKNYAFPMTQTQAQALLKRVQTVAKAPAGPGVAPKPAPTKFVWRRKDAGFALLQPEETVATYRANANYTCSGSEGVVTFGYRTGAETCRFAVTWNRPPDRLAPGETVRITVKASDTGCTAATGGAGGSVGAFIQRTSGGTWDLLYGNQPMVGIKGRDAPSSRDYVFAMPEGRPGQQIVVKVSVWDTLIGSEYVVVYVCE